MNESEMPMVPIDNLRDKVAALEQQMLPMPQVTMEPVHHFSAGLYARELTIPAGTLIVGKAHKFDHLNFLVKGDITVFTEGGMKRLKAPCILESKAGIKRVGFTHEETTWVTVHATDATKGCDLEQLENDLTVPTMDDYDRYLADVHKQLVEEDTL